MAARNLQLLESAAAPLRSSGRTVLTIAADITSQDDVDRLFQRTVEEFGRLDVLVNGAGRSARGQVIETTPEEFLALMDLNFIAAVRCVRAAVPHLIANARVTWSMSVRLSGKSASRYVGATPASKFALAAYTQQLRLELSPQGLHVLLVSPGPIARENAEQRYSDQVAGLPERAKRPGTGVKLRAVSPEKLSEAIVRACERRRPELVYPPYMRILVALGPAFAEIGRLDRPPLDLMFAGNSWPQHQRAEGMELGIDIVPITEEHVAGFHAVLDRVARRTEVLGDGRGRPPLEKVRQFIRRNIESGAAAMGRHRRYSTGQTRGCRLVRHPARRTRGIPACRAARHRSASRVSRTWNRIAAGIGRDPSAPDLGLERVELEVFTSNLPAIRMYERLGFQRRRSPPPHPQARWLLRRQLANEPAIRCAAKCSDLTCAGTGQVRPLQLP